MKQLTESEMRHLMYKSLSPEELRRVREEWPRCFVCGGFAEGTNRTSDMWACGPHWATSLDEALALKGITKIEP